MKTKDIVNIALFTTLLAVCAWICIPTAVPFTMQTFAVFLAVQVLGGKKGTIVIGVYMLLGIMGVPVFSGGTAGIGSVMGPTGGYMIGWIFLSIIFGMFEPLSEGRKWAEMIVLIAGLCICYGFGTFWFMHIYAKGNTNTDLLMVLSTCVIPFIVPDFVKLMLSSTVSKRIKRIVKNV